MMHGREKSDLAIVAMKPANKANEPTAEASTGAISALRIRRYIGSSSKGPNHRGLRHAFFGAVPVDEPFFDIGFMIHLRTFNAAAPDGDDRDLFVRVAKSPLASMSADGAVCASKTLI